MSKFCAGFLYNCDFTVLSMLHILVFMWLHVLEELLLMQYYKVSYNTTPQYTFTAPGVFSLCLHIASNKIQRKQTKLSTKSSLKVA